MQQSSFYLNDLERHLHLPFPLGPLARIVIDYHRNWGLDPESSDYLQQLEEADDSYVHEYATSTGSRSKVIGSITGRNYNHELNFHNGIVVANLAYDIQGPINITDLGGGDGATTEAAYDAMKNLWLSNGRSLDDLLDRLHVTFVEPSKGMMGDAHERIGPLGIRYTPLNIPAHEITAFMQHDSQDIVMETAALHHYADPQKPYKTAYKVLKQGGVLVLNEWCHSLFEHSLRFREVLERLEWPEKEQDLEEYNKYFWLRPEDKYPEAQNPYEAAANRQMLDWYADRLSRTVDYTFFTLEAHCPPRITMEHLQQSGFSTKSSVIDRLISGGVINSNPHLLTPENSLHASIVAVKQ